MARARWMIVVTLMLAVPSVLLAACLVHGALPFPAPMSICFTTHHAASMVPPAGFTGTPALPGSAPAGPLGASYVATPPPSLERNADVLFGRLRI